MRVRLARILANAATSRWRLRPVRQVLFEPIEKDTLIGVKQLACLAEGHKTHLIHFPGRHARDGILRGGTGEAGDALAAAAIVGVAQGDEAKGDWAMAGLTTIGRSDDGRGQWVMGEGDFLSFDPFTRASRWAMGLPLASQDRAHGKRNKSATVLAPWASLGCELGSSCP